MRDWPPALTLGKAETTLLMEAITHNLGVEDGAEHMEAIEAPAAEAAMNTRYDQWIKASSNPSTLFYFYFLVFFLFFVPVSTLQIRLQNTIFVLINCALATMYLFLPFFVLIFLQSLCRCK
jgi:hypothetical protein